MVAAKISGWIGSFDFVRREFRTAPDMSTGG